MKTIRELRQAAGITQRTLAERLKVTTATVYNWERRTHEPKASQVREMARMFGVSMDDIAFEPADKTKRAHPEG